MLCANYPYMEPKAKLINKYQKNSANVYRRYLVHLVFSNSIFPIFRVFSIYRFPQIWVYWYLIQKITGITVSLYPPPPLAGPVKLPSLAGIYLQQS